MPEQITVDEYLAALRHQDPDLVPGLSPAFAKMTAAMADFFDAARFHPSGEFTYDDARQQLEQVIHSAPYVPVELAEPAPPAAGRPQVIIMGADDIEGADLPDEVKEAILRTLAAMRDEDDDREEMGQ
jgi:hypothetical protein